MKGLDLSRLKKVESDDKSTVFKHANGHTIKIAHSGLSPKILSELQSLPIHGKKMASGGDANLKGVHPDLGNWETGKPGTSGAGRNIRQGGDANRSEAKDHHRQKLQEIKQMPKPKLMADGGDASDDDSGDDGSDQSSQAGGVNININPAPNQPSPQPNVSPQPMPQAGSPSPVPAQYVPGVSPPGPVATTGLNPNNTGVDVSPVDPNDPNAQADRAPASSKQDQTSDNQIQQAQNAPMQSPPQTPMDVKQQTHQELSAEDQAWQQDLANGHITPETYQSLFNKKDTLGKVGTLFGLMLSGAGSGLSHQPNAVMTMMNNEIKNDLEAQKQSKNNAQNYIRLNQQNLMNQAQVKATNVETETKGYALANMQMNRAALHQLVMQTNKLPVGSPERQQAEQTLAMLNQSVNTENFNIADRAATAAAYNKMLFGNSQGAPQGGEQAFQQKDIGMRMLGQQGESMAKNMEEKHFPGLQGQASVPLSADDRDQLNSGITFDQKLHRFMDWTQNHSGDLNPADRKQGAALAAELQGAYRQATHGGVYKEGEQNFISKLIDSDPTKFLNEFRVMPQLKAIAGENQARVDQLAKSKGFQGYQGSQPQSQGQGQGQVKTMNGLQYRQVPGGWQRVK